MPRKLGQRNKGGKDPNIITLGGSTKLRPIHGGVVAEWWQHIVEDPEDADQVVFVTCPQRGCPLCRKPTSPDGEPYFPKSYRNAMNVWCYETDQEGLKILVAGKTVFSPFDDAAEVGIEPSDCDWIILKTGSGIHTKYSVQRLDKSAATFQVAPDELLDVEKFEKPASVQQIFEVLEKQNIDYDKLPIPSFASVEDAYAYVVPFGKHKGQTLEQVFASDSGWVDWLYNMRKDNGEYGDASFLAIHKIMEERGDAEPIPELDRAPSADYTPADDATAPEGDPAPATVNLISPDGSEVQVPDSAVDALIAAGYKKPLDEPTEEGMVTMRGPDGNIVTIQQGSKGALISAGFVQVTAEPEPEAESQAFSVADDEKVPFNLKGIPNPVELPYSDCVKIRSEGNGDFAGPHAADLVAFTDEGLASTAVSTPPREVPDDEQVQVSIAGAETMMAFSMAVTVMNAGTAIEFVDPEVDRFAQTKLEFNQRQSEPRQSAVGKAMAQDPAVEQLHSDAAAEHSGGKPMDGGGSPTQPPADPLDPALMSQNAEGEYEHPAIPGKKYKGKGGVTQALNKLRKAGAGAAPAADATSTPAPGGSDIDAARERVKDLLGKQNTRDFSVLLELFEEVAGKRDVMQFDLPELLKLEEKLKERTADAS